jgi:hypothetical protein
MESVGRVALSPSIWLRIFIKPLDLKLFRERRKRKEIEANGTSSF